MTDADIRDGEGGKPDIGDFVVAGLNPDIGIVFFLNIF